MFIANYYNGDEDDWFIFVAPENCDRLKEFKHAYKCENCQDGEEIPDYVQIGEIYDITTAFDYRAEDSGEYNINLIKQ